MKKNLFLFLLLPVLFFACSKNEVNQIKKEQSVIASPYHAVALTSTDPTLNIDANYFASGSQLSVFANITWPSSNVPADLYNYSIRFQATGVSTYTTGINAMGASWNTTLSFTSTTQAYTVTVSAELIKNSQVVSSSSYDLTIIPLVNTSTQPTDSVATITLTQTDPWSNQYYLNVTNLNFLNGYPNKSVDLYAFYFPTDDQRYNQNIKPVFLGKQTIYGSTFFPTEGGMYVQLPGASYPVSNIRVFVTKTAYSYDYFTNSLINMGITDYLIDWCLQDIYIYAPLRGLNTTNIGRFTTSYPSQITTTIGSLDMTLNTVIYYLKDRNWIW